MSATAVELSSRCLREFAYCDPTLQEILLWVADQWPPTLMLVGNIYRTSAEETAAGGVSGIHCAGPPYRAVDVRVSNLSGDSQAAADAIGALVNRRWEYDPSRPTKLVAFTQPHGTGPHVHLQVHANTRLRGSLYA